MLYVDMNTLNWWLCETLEPEAVKLQPGGLREFSCLLQINQPNNLSAYRHTPWFILFHPVSSWYFILEKSLSFKAITLRWKKNVGVRGSYSMSEPHSGYNRCILFVHNGAGVGVGGLALSLLPCRSCPVTCSQYHWHLVLKYVSNYSNHFT